MKIKKFLTSLDSFGHSPSFNINGNEKVNSLLGGIFTLLNKLFFIVILLYNLSLFFSKNDPIVTVTNKYRNASAVEKVDSINFTFFILNINNNGLVPIKLNSESKIIQGLMDLKIKATPDYVIKGSILKCNNKTINYENEEFLNLFKILGKDNILCSKINDQLNLGGDILKSMSTNAIKSKISLNLCEILPQCKNRTLLSLMKSSRIGFAIENVFTNVTDKLGYTSYVDNNYEELDYNLDYYYSIKVTKNTLFTDINSIYNFLQPRENYYYQYTVYLKTKPRSEGDNSLNINLEFIIDNYENVYYRSYIKLDSVLANVLSVTSIIDIFLIILINIFTYAGVELELIKNLYYFGELNQYNKENIVLINIKSKAESYDSNKLNKLIKEEVVSEDSIRDKYIRRNINYDYRLYIFKIFRCERKKTINIKLIEKGINLIQNDLNLVYILKRLIDLEKIRSLMFTNLQLDAISLIRNRIITSNIDENIKIQELFKLYENKTSFNSSDFKKIKESDDTKDNNIINELLNIYEI